MTDTQTLITQAIEACDLHWEATGDVVDREIEDVRIELDDMEAHDQAIEWAELADEWAENQGGLS